MKRLLLFDIDGTLCDTVGIDEVCLSRSLSETLGTTIQSLQPFSGVHGTDTEMTTEAFRILRGRAASSHEIAAVQLRFLQHLLAARRDSPQSFVEKRGAREACLRLASHVGWEVGFASGAWRDSAALKLEAIGVSIRSYPGAFAEDSPNREEIITMAIDRARVRYKTTSWEQIVYVGDGPWDVRAARAVRIGFVGVGSGDRRERLIRSGATRVLEDFSDLAAFRVALNSSSIPMELHESVR